MSHILPTHTFQLENGVLKHFNGDNIQIASYTQEQLQEQRTTILEQRTKEIEYVDELLAKFNQ